MKIRSLLIKRAANLKEYPTFLVRLIIAILAGFLVMDFDCINTGKNIAEGNYLVTKIFICIFTLLLLEYIYYSHIWWSRKLELSSNRISKLIVTQIVFGLILPLLLILELLHLFGITFIPLELADIVPESYGDRSKAIVIELIIMFNMVLLMFYLPLPGYPSDVNYKYKNLYIFKYGKTIKIDIEEITAIICFKEKINFVITKEVEAFPLLDGNSLRNILKKLPNDQFELRFNGIFIKSFEAAKEHVITEYINALGEYIIISHFQSR